MGACLYDQVSDIFGEIGIRYDRQARLCTRLVRDDDLNDSETAIDTRPTLPYQRRTYTNTNYAVAMPNLYSHPVTRNLAPIDVCRVQHCVKASPSRRCMPALRQTRGVGFDPPCARGPRTRAATNSSGCVDGRQAPRRLQICVIRRPPSRTHARFRLRSFGCALRTGGSRAPSSLSFSQPRPACTAQDTFVAFGLRRSDARHPSRRCAHCFARVLHSAAPWRRHPLFPSCPSITR